VFLKKLLDVKDTVLTPQNPPLVIDFHCHLLEKTVFEAATNKTVFTGFGATPASAPRPGARELMSRMFDPTAVIADMDERGIDKSVISSSTVLQGSSWADPKTDLALCQRCNDETAQWVSRYPDRFIGSMVLPLQATDLANLEVERATNELQLSVANLSTSYQSAYLGDPIFHEFWSQMAEKNIVAWVHPEGIRDPWFQRYAMWNSVGQSIEETKCMASLIYEGVLTKFPSLKIVIAHGGGYFPHYMGRMDRNTVNRPDTVRNMNGETPSSFLNRFYYDSCVYDPAVLKVLIERVGTDRIVMGSDYPIGEKDPLGWLKLCGLTGQTLNDVAGENAARLLGISVERPIDSKANLWRNG
jgi:aminocarboxymuconate-semialdehyde decarboxylase